jgi:predicted PolB exonuclease-like 3'-5' exonuclease
MLKEFSKILAKADEIVAHNGDRFDLKWIRTRALIHGISVMPSPKSIDTLKWAKKYFNFNSNKLDYIAKFLNVGAKMDTGGLDLWKDIVFRKDQEALDKMVKYCKMDVEVLEAVFNKLNAYTLANHNYAVQHGGDKYECPECGGINVKYNKKVVTTAGTVHHWILCKDCKKHYKINHLVFTKYQEYLYKRKSIA